VKLKLYFGVVLIEALALGKPVISTRSGGPEDIVEEYNGLLVPVNNVEALADAMQYMVDNYYKFDQTEIQHRCYKKYSEESVGKALEELYWQVLKQDKTT